MKKLKFNVYTYVSNDTFLIPTIVIVGGGFGLIWLNRKLVFCNFRFV